MQIAEEECGATRTASGAVCWEAAAGRPGCAAQALAEWGGQVSGWRPSYKDWDADWGMMWVEALTEKQRYLNWFGVLSRLRSDQFSLKPWCLDRWWALAFWSATVPHQMALHWSWLLGDGREIEPGQEERGCCSVAAVWKWWVILPVGNVGVWGFPSLPSSHPTTLFYLKGKT